jgi:hypothetical protein
VRVRARRGSLWARGRSRGEGALIVLLAVWCAALRRVLCATAPRTHGTLRPQILAGRPKVTLKGLPAEALATRDVAEALV